MKTFENHKGQMVGWLKDGIYRKVVDSTIHKMKVYDGYGIDIEIMDTMAFDCQEIRLKEKDTGNIYSVSYAIFREKGIERDFGNGTQVFLPLRYWKKENDNNKDGTNRSE